MRIINSILATALRPYFYFRCVWPDDIETPLLTMLPKININKFDVDAAFCYDLRRFCCWRVAWSRDLDLWPLIFKSCHIWRVTHSTRSPSLNDQRLFVLWVTTVWDIEAIKKTRWPHRLNSNLLVTHLYAGQSFGDTVVTLNVCLIGPIMLSSLFLVFWDRLCRDVVGRWLVVTRVHCGQTVHPRPIVTMEH